MYTSVSQVVSFLHISLIKFLSVSVMHATWHAHFSGIAVPYSLNFLKLVYSVSYIVYTER